MSPEHSGKRGEHWDHLFAGERVHKTKPFFFFFYQLRSWWICGKRVISSKHWALLCRKKCSLFYILFTIIIPFYRLLSSFERWKSNPPKEPHKCVWPWSSALTTKGSRPWLAEALVNSRKKWGWVAVELGVFSLTAPKRSFHAQTHLFHSAGCTGLCIPCLCWHFGQWHRSPAY